MKRLYKMGDLENIFQRCPAVIYREIKEGKFPPPIKLGRSSRWHPDVIEAYVEEKAKESTEATA